VHREHVTAPRIYSCAEWSARPPSDALVTLNHPTNRILCTTSRARTARITRCSTRFRPERPGRPHGQQRVGGHRSALHHQPWRVQARRAPRQPQHLALQHPDDQGCAPGRTRTPSASRTKAFTPASNRRRRNGTRWSSSAATSASGTGFRSRRSRDTATTTTLYARATGSTRSCHSRAKRWRPRLPGRAR
jgi:hypothetical protein